MSNATSEISRYPYNKNVSKGSRLKFTEQYLNRVEIHITAGNNLMITQTDNGGKSNYQVLETIIQQQRFIMRVSELDALLERLEQIKSVSTEERKKLFDLAIQLAPIGSWTI